MSLPQAPFARRVEIALADVQLHVALERVTGRFSAMRAAGLASLPDADAVRDRARAIRLQTLSHLDEYLEQFAAAVERAGGRVHWAADAAEANAIVVALAREQGVRLAVKSKSMVSEELELNRTLEAAGMQVIESDLGEYIIQLAGETPSHIIAPAVHKTREQIGELMHTMLGIPLSDDPAVLAAAARERLREVFLTAGMGISGVNFAVAATGTLCIVTNEGNGRLTTTAPRLHVALLGIERLVPTLDDLSLMLQILARSASGQKLSVYTNLITGPRQAGEADGPEELHVVLVDNGRSRVLAGEVAEILACIRCGACLNVCPVYREIGGHAYGGVYTGPVGAVLAPALHGLAGRSELPFASTLCGACREACPVRIDLPALLLRQRAAVHRAGYTPAWLRAGLRLYRALGTRPRLYAAGLALARAATRLAGRGGWLRRLPPPLAGWTDHRDFPALAPRSFSARLRAERRAGAATREGADDREAGR
jgi:L-lactate dehydrogenase complex protein LldF